MTKQEEIREGLARKLHGGHPNAFDVTLVHEYYLSLADTCLNYLHSQGVVIEVDRELPDWLMEGQVACDKPTYQEMLRRAGYVATEPLIN